MKKLFILILVLILAFVGAIHHFDLGSKLVPSLSETAPEPAVLSAEEAGSEEAESEEASAVDSEQSPEEPEEVSTMLDFDALYALHKPEDVVMSLNGEDITWGEYFYCLFSQASQVRNTMEQMKQYYGLSSTWADPLDEEGNTIADLAVDNSIEMLKQQQAIVKLASDNEIELSDEDKAILEEEMQAYITSLCGEDGTQEDFDEVLKGLYITRELFDKINSLSILNDRIKIELYGKNAEKISDEDAIKYLEDNDYLCCTHILLMTVDSATREALDETAVAEKKAKAEELAATLQAIEDKDELKETFAKLKEELCEDTGKLYYPDGYLFTPGTMVSVFEDTTRALEPMQVSDPVESSYGYHIIMRLPYDPDMIIQSSTGASNTARTLLASSRFNESIQALMDAAEIEYLNGYTAPRLTDFLRKP